MIIQTRLNGWLNYFSTVALALRFSRKLFVSVVTSVLWLLWFAVPPTQAQLYTGSLTGIVKDPSGAVVPNAKIALVDTGKGFVFSATSDEVTGRYVLRSLPPSTYKLTVAAPGFKGFGRDHIILEVNQNATIDVTLGPGAVQETVEVTTEAPLLSTQDAVTGQGINRIAINDLPLENRAVLDLAHLAPGVNQVDDTCGLSGCGVPNNFIASGSRNVTADILMDGATTSNFGPNNGSLLNVYIPSVDAVQEFKVQESNFSAEFGFTGSTIVNLVTRSGTNGFHGTVYDFNRPRPLDAQDFFSHRAGLPLPGLHWNDYGATLGGPIRKNHTFFFFDYEGTRSGSLASLVAGVPSAAMRTGDFGEVCTGPDVGGTFDASGNCSNPNGQLWDPYSGVFDPVQGFVVRNTPIPFNNFITYQSPGNPKLNGTPYQPLARPGNLIDPVALKLMNYYPLPNVNVGQASYTRFNNWAGSHSDRGRNDQFDLKIDHRFNDNNLLSAKYSQQWNYYHAAPCFGNVADPCTNGPQDLSAHMFALNYNRSFSPKSMLVLSYGFNRSFTGFKGINGDFPGTSPVSTLGMPSYMLRSGYPQLPAIYVNGNYAAVSGLGSIGSGICTVLGWGSDTHQVEGTFMHQMGLHQLKFGAEMRMHRVNNTQPCFPAGQFTFDFTTTSQNPNAGSGGDAMAGFLFGGGYGSSGIYEVPNGVATQSFQYAGFLQDDLHARRNLTLNLGLRYEVETPRTERYNRMNWLDPNVLSPLRVPGLGPLHGGEVFTDRKHRMDYPADYGEIQPRLGFAYSLNPKTVLRGGYGIYFSVSKRAATGIGAVGFQGYDEMTTVVPTFHNDQATPWERLTDPYPGVGPNLPPGSSLGLLNDIGFHAQGPIFSDRYRATPKEQSWTFGLQREIGWGVAIDASYFGKKGTHLYYGGAGELNHLGPATDSLSTAQIAALANPIANPFFGIITDPNSPLSSPTVPEWQLQVPFPQFPGGFTNDDPPFANSIYHALQMRVEKHFSNGLQFLVTYVNSKSIDNASLSGGNISFFGSHSSLQDPNRLDLERSLSVFDIPQVLQFSYEYTLPFGRGRPIGGNLHGVADVILGGWKTSGLWRMANGQPIMLSLSGGTGIPTYGAQRPNLTGQLHVISGNSGIEKNGLTYFTNPQVAVAPANFTLGNAPRVLPNVRTPGSINADLSMLKEFSLNTLREGMRLEYRFETFNTFNHPRFCAPNATVNSGLFGLITAQCNSPRQVQMGLKLYF